VQSAISQPHQSADNRRSFDPQIGVVHTLPHFSISSLMRARIRRRLATGLKPSTQAALDVGTCDGLGDLAIKQLDDLFWRPAGATMPVSVSAS